MNFEDFEEEEEIDDFIDDIQNYSFRRKRRRRNGSEMMREEIKMKRIAQDKTLLIAACQFNSINIVKRLMKMTAEGIFDINAVDSFDGMAPLHYICQNGNERLLNLFIQFEKENPGIINWNIQNKNGMTPLHIAVVKKNVSIVDTLINNEIVCPHIDINAQATGEFENGRTPLSFACEKNCIEIVKLLLSDTDFGDENKKDPLSSFAKNSKKLEEIKKIRGSLCNAKSSCDLTIKANAAHQKGMNCLHYACKSNCIEVVKYLLNHGGFDVNARASGKSCLFLACKFNRIEIVKMLLENPDVDYNIKTQRGFTPLMVAAEEGRAQIVEMLLKLKKIDVNALTADGKSARKLAKNQAIRMLFDKYKS